MRSNRGHLRPGTFGQNGGHDVPTKGLASLQQESPVINRQSSAVSSESSSEFRGHGPREIPTKASRTNEQYLRLVFLNQIADRLVVGLSAIVTEHRGIQQ